MTRETNYIVTLANIIVADNPNDAVKQMVAYVADYGPQAGYRVEDVTTGQEWFIDAEELNIQ